MSSMRRRGLAVLGAVAALLLIAGWGHGRLPPLEPRTPSGAVPDLASTDLARAIGPVATADGRSDRTGVLAITSNTDALAARVLLADSARRSLDVQYYIWHDDVSGSLLLDALRRAAVRGVRVRLLIDDGGTTGMDEVLAAFDRHPNVEVRLFNPFAQRHLRWLAFLTDFERLNRRMHNKSFTADGAATIVGGRNVGDEYFGIADDVNFLDLDVLAVGKIVPEVSAEFDSYWSSASAYPADRLLPRPTDEAVARLDEAARRRGEERLARDYGKAVDRSESVRALLAGKLEFEWTHVRLVSDEPDKVLGGKPVADSLPDALGELLGSPRQELQIVSSYFVPTEAGVAKLAELARCGVKVSVLTNSLAATDVAAVHAGYADSRAPLLRSGVALRELKSGERSDSRPKLVFLGSRAGGGSSAASLHAKTFAADRSRVYVGSLNFDPRSVRLNTEMGFIIDSPAIAARTSDFFRDGLAERAWQLGLDANGKLRWTDPQDGHSVDHEPDASRSLRAAVEVLSWLPIEGLL